MARVRAGAGVGVSVLVAVLAFPVSATGASAPGPAVRGAVGTMVGCSDAVAPSPRLVHVESHFATGLLTPFGVAFAPGGKEVFTDSLVNPEQPPPGPGPGRAASAVERYSVTPSGLARARVGTFPDEPSLLGLTMSPDGHDLVAAAGSGASVFSVPRLEQPGSRPSSWLLGSFTTKGAGAIEVAVSPDGHDVFVSLEDTDELAVFDLERALAVGFGPSDLVGTIRMGVAPVGMAISPDGRFLYATSEVATPSGQEGTLTTVDLHRAEVDPSRSVVSTVWAGCSPVRVVATKSSVYVTARGSDDLLEFSAPALASHPASALVGKVAVGEAPVGVALVEHGTRIVVADSNRFEVGGAEANLAVISDRGSSLALEGYVGAGDFPRDMAVSRDGATLVVSDYGSGDLEQVAVRTLP